MSVTISTAEPLLKRSGISTNAEVHYQQSPQELVRACIQSGQGSLNDTGALVIRTGEFTGRSPKDKFIVRDHISADTVHWNDFNIPIEQKYFDIIHQKITEYLGARRELWVRDCYACADEDFRMNIRVVTEKPWIDLFAYNMFLRPDNGELDELEPEWQILSAPDLKLNAAECGIRQHNAAVISFRRKMILIAGTGYTGETKKGIFSVLNFILPYQKHVLSMHCSANMSKDGDTALFFGLSGTGKTTLSADPDRLLIGDDEHGWTDEGVFNFEGGCYAKTIDLSEEKEPEIYRAVRPGALVENVVFHAGSNKIDFTDGSITENTRVSYPIDFIPNAVIPSIGNIPSNIFFLTCDASGVLPPISLLTAEQAMYQFISGYTAKVAGTETGITEPKSTFSACFGAPFLPLHPGVYAKMLGERLRRYGSKVWLVNTGWTGGPYGVGSRIKLSYTRAMIKAALEGSLNNVETITDPVFGVKVPSQCEGVPPAILKPRETWTNKAEYDIAAKKLAAQFVENFKKYQQGVDKEIVAAAPKI